VSPEAADLTQPEPSPGIVGSTTPRDREQVISSEPEPTGVPAYGTNRDTR
jgi:hypothetical protein